MNESVLLLPINYVGSVNHSISSPAPVLAQHHGLAHNIINTVMATQSGKVSAAVLGTMLALLVVATSLSPKVAHEEPTMLKPRVPLIGHIYGLMVGQMGYLLGLL